jgi:hypothetical protein
MMNGRNRGCGFLKDFDSLFVLPNNKDGMALLDPVDAIHDNASSIPCIMDDV